MEEEICDTDVFEEESEDEEASSDVDQKTDGGSSQDEDQVAVTAGNATYYAVLFPGRLRRRKILIQQPWIDATPECEMNAFNLFYRCKIIL